MCSSDLDPTTYGADSKLVLGANARIKDPRLSVAITTRVLEIERDYLTPADTRISLSNNPDDLSGSFARPKRVNRISTETGETTDAIGAGELKLQMISESTTERTYRVTLGAFVVEAWVGIQEFDSPLPSLPWDTVAEQTAPLDGDTFVVRRPPAARITLIQVEPRGSDFSVTGKPWQVEYPGPDPQAPVWEVSVLNSDDVLTVYARAQTRGETLVSVMAQVQTGNDDPSGWMLPTRDAGDYSYVKERTLEGPEVEHDVRKDQTRLSRIQFRAVLASGEVMTTEPIYGDRNTTPDWAITYGEGSIATAIGDDDTVSVRAQRVNAVGTPIGWDYWIDGRALRVDVQTTAGNGHGGVQIPMAAGETWSILLTAYSKPRQDPNVETSAKDTALVTVVGSSATPPIWEYANVAAPLTNGSHDIPISLDADSSSGLTVRVTERHNAGAGFTAQADITSALSPSITTPPTTRTDYTWSGLSSVYDRVDPGGGALPVELELTFQILDSTGAAVATEKRSAIWYYAGSPGFLVPPSAPIPDPILPTPDTVPSWDAVSVAGPTTNGNRNVTVTRDASSADGTVQLIERRDDGYGWTIPLDITSVVTPALSTPPASSTAYAWSGPSDSMYNKVTSGTPITVEIEARLIQNGVTVASRVVRTTWQYQDERI